MYTKEKLPAHKKMTAARTEKRILTSSILNKIGSLSVRLKSVYIPFPPRQIARAAQNALKSKNTPVMASRTFLFFGSFLTRRYTPAAMGNKIDNAMYRITTSIISRPSGEHGKTLADQVNHRLGTYTQNHVQNSETN